MRGLLFAQLTVSTGESDQGRGKRRVTPRQPSDHGGGNPHRGDGRRDPPAQGQRLHPGPREGRAAAVSARLTAMSLLVCLFPKEPDSPEPIHTRVPSVCHTPAVF